MLKERGQDGERRNCIGHSASVRKTVNTLGERKESEKTRTAVAAQNSGLIKDDSLVSYSLLLSVITV